MEFASALSLLSLRCSFSLLLCLFFIACASPSLSSLSLLLCSITFNLHSSAITHTLNTREMKGPRVSGKNFHSFKWTVWCETWPECEEEKKRRCQAKTLRPNSRERNDTKKERGRSHRKRGDREEGRVKKDKRAVNLSTLPISVILRFSSISSFTRDCVLKRKHKQGGREMKRLNWYTDTHGPRWKGCLSTSPAAFSIKCDLCHLHSVWKIFPLSQSTVTLFLCLLLSSEVR